MSGINNSSNSRRDFLKKSVAGRAIVDPSNPFAMHAKNLPFVDNPGKELPWFQRVTRWGQINITEKDPAQYDISWWRSFWKQTNTEGIVVKLQTLTYPGGSQNFLIRKRFMKVLIEIV